MDNTEIIKTMEKAYRYKLSSIIFHPPTISQAIRNLHTILNENHVYTIHEMKKLVELLSSLHNNDKRIKILHEIYGEMRKYEPLERKLVPGPAIGATLADIHAFYKAFGLKIKEDTLVDHLSVEMEFMAHMELRKAYALANKNREMFTIVSKAEDDFLRDHLGRTAVFITALEQVEDEVLKGLAGAVISFLNEELRLRGLENIGNVIRIVEVERDAVRCPFAEPNT